MSTITKERVANLLQFNSEGSDCQANAEQWEVHELARIALASLEADPVAYTEKCEITNMQATGLYLRGFPDNSQGRDIALYTAPPAPVSVPDEMTKSLTSIAMEYQTTPQNALFIVVGWNACRAVMLQSFGNSAQLNSPVIPDGWVACSERMPKKGEEVLCTDQFENYETALYDTGYIPGPPFFATTAGEFHPTHWMPLPSPPAK